MRLPRSLAPALLSTVLVLLAACSSESASPPRPTHPEEANGTTTTTVPRIDLDPERYYLDYSSAVEADGTVYNASPAPSAGGGDRFSGAGEATPFQPEVAITDDNTFVDPGENGLVSTQEQPNSTFGLDVDTGSPSIGRTFLESGLLPPPASVRTEEWVNAFGSAQPGPSDGAVGVTVDGVASPETTTGTHLLRVGVAAADLDASDRPPANLTLVVDTSGSMDIRERLGLVKASLGLLVLNLRDEDTIAIVEYSDEAGVVLEPTPVRDAGTIVSAIDRLQPSDSTNLEAGLRAGYRQASAAFRPDGVNAVILASDGVANVGLTDPDGLAAVIQDRAEAGIHLVTVGYGMGNYNDHLMEQVADKGDGFYAYLDTYEQAERLFGDRITSTLTVVGGDAKAQVAFDPERVSGYRLLGYENRALNDEQFDDDSVDAGELGAGHRVTALYEVTLAGSEASDPPTADLVLGTVSIRYRSTGEGRLVEVEVPISSGDLAGDLAEAPADLRLQAAAAAFAQWLAAQPDGAIPTGPAGDPVEPRPIDEVPANVAIDPPTTPLPAGLGEIRKLAAGAVVDLDGRTLLGSSLDPEDLVELIDLAATATPAGGGYDRDY